MAFTYEQLKHKTIGELREMAKDLHHPALQGFTQMNKEHLLPALCKALNVEIHTHHDVVGIDKSTIKARLHALKVERDRLLTAGDPKALRAVRRQMHTLKRRIRAATV
jgi:hypothetical protein